MKVDFLPRDRIESAAMRLLGAYGLQFGEVTAPPVPVEEILESHLGLDLDFDDLTAIIGVPDVLGATWLRDRRVVIDQTLDPTEHPAKEGRYRFTVAHELGHWELHRHRFQGNVTHSLFFTAEPQPSIVCRTSSRKEPIEWQADTFAGYLLMPKEMVLGAWREEHGSLEPYIAVGEMADLSAQWGLEEDARPTVEISRRMAGRFRVSGQAMQIRLVGLGLVSTEVPKPDIFASSISIPTERSNHHG